MIEKIKQFRFLEWLWVAHTVLWVLIAIAYLTANNGAIGEGLMLGALAFPLVWPVSHLHFLALWPDEFTRAIFAVVLFLNGWLWYRVLRWCFRRKPRTDGDTQPTTSGPDS